LLAWLDAIAPSIPPHPAFKTAIDLRPSSRFYSHSEVIGSFVGSAGAAKSIRQAAFGEALWSAWRSTPCEV